MFVVFIVLFIVFAMTNSQAERTTQENEEIVAISNELLHTNDRLIKLMRRFATSHSLETLNEYEATLDKLDDIIDRLEGVTDRLTPSEQNRVNQMMGVLDTLESVETRALDAFGRGDLEGCSNYINSDEYYQADRTLEEHTMSLIYEISNRANADSARNKALINAWLVFFAAFILIAVFGFMLLINFIVKKFFWYESIINAVPFAVTVIDNDMNFTLLNKAGLDAIGKDWKDIKGRPCNAWAHTCTACNTPQCGVECFKRGELVTEYQTADGYHCKVDIAALHDPRGRQVGYVEIDQDITEMVLEHKKNEGLIEGVRQVSAAFADGTKQISDGAQSLAHGSLEQAATIDKLSASINEIKTQTAQNVDVAKQAASLSYTIRDNAEKGSAQMGNMMQAVQEINDASSQIGKVIKVIDDIAFQTNILALNAAVEAARAGQHGKGFAVVAEEVRNLASKSAEAARNTGGLIENSIEKAHLGLSIATETSTSLSEIVEGINHSAQIAAQIAESSTAQTTAIEYLNEGITQVADVVRQNSASAQQSASASQEMTNQAEYLQKLIREEGNGRNYESL